uniref:Endonuclease/exonuclease/phosphatase domain-containing protein n=1 Tax=Sus scrofa TaxID=9823 RepID=A0A8W4FM95_PIG
MIKGSIQDDITILNIYAPNTGSPQYIRQLLTTLKGQTDNNTIIVGDFNTTIATLAAMDRSTRQKIKKETQYLNNTIDQMVLTDTYRTFLPTAAIYTHFSQVYTEHFLG